MKKLFYSVMVVLGATMTGCSKDNMRLYENCHCNICVACDSLDSICHSNPADSIVDIYGDNHAQYIHNKGFELWYDSLTNMTVEDMRYHYNTALTTAEFDAWFEKEYIGNIKIMHLLEEGFDGWCGDFGSESNKMLNHVYDILEKNSTKIN